MQQRRPVHVLMYGIPKPEWIEYVREVRRMIHEMNMGCQFSCAFAGGVREAVKYIRERNRLDLVFIGEQAAGAMSLQENAVRIAGAMAERKKRPWVVLDFGLESFRAGFDQARLRVFVGMIEFALEDRWRKRRRRRARSPR